MNSLADSNIVLLEQLGALLDTLDDEAYVQPHPGIGLSGIGPHVRHCLDFYARLLAGAPAGRVDYDDRPREQRLETSCRAARLRVTELAASLPSLARADRRLRVRMDGVEAPSDVQRELLALQSHTVHHLALIAVLLRAQGRLPPAGFGVSPSTLRHEQELHSVAP
jgi:hypothetical protein